MDFGELSQALSLRTEGVVEEHVLKQFIQRDECLAALLARAMSSTEQLGEADVKTICERYLQCYKEDFQQPEKKSLRLYLQGVPLFSVELGQETSILVGRSREAGFFLNDSQNVAVRHCRILLDKSKSFIEPVDPEGKALTLNGNSLSQKVVLHNGDIIGLGKLQISVVISDAIPRQNRMTHVTSIMPPSLTSMPPSLPSDDIEGTMIASATCFSDPAKASQSAKRRHIIIPLTTQALTIGRSPDYCDIHLDDPMVSRRHAQVNRTDFGDFIEDMGSTNGVYLNGQRIGRRALIQKGDLIIIGPYRLRHEGNLLTSVRKDIGTQVHVCSLGKRVINRGSGEPLWLLRDINLSIQPKEFVGLMGASGSGKSTFMDAINGRRPATHGSVFFDGQDLYHTFESLKSDIGYVPQNVVLHEDLPLIDVLRYSSRLRLSQDVSKEEHEENIISVLHKVGLSDKLHTRVSFLSGGQKKKVTIAMELLSKPWIIFFDEVTSGLDIESENQAMELFRSLSSDDKLSVVCITHFVDSLERCDMIAHFCRGRLAFYGKPDEFKAFFGIEKIHEVYRVEAEQKPEEWAEKFRSSEYFKHYVEERASADPAAESLKEDQLINLETVGRKSFAWGKQSLGRLLKKDFDGFRKDQAILLDRWSQRIRGGHPIREFIQQFTILRQRYVKCVRADRNQLVITLSLAPLVALLVCILSMSIHQGAFEDLDVSDYNAIENYITSQRVLCFGGVISAFFLALFISVREIVKELPIYHHERFTRLLILSYLSSKYVVLGTLCAVQCFLLLLVLRFVGGLEGGSFLFTYGVLWGTSLVGLWLGLLLSSAAPSSDWAVNIMIAVVIPQLLFSGGTVRLEKTASVIAKTFIICYWGLQALIGRYDVDLSVPMNFDNASIPEIYHIMVIYLFQMIFLALVTYVMMVRKDGPGAVERLLRGAWKFIIPSR